MNLLLIGIASYYSIAGCLGCSSSFTMANGQRLDDTKMTVALTPANFRAYKNKFVDITNVKNGKTVRAKVTDTGGFGKYNRVADLSLATKKALGCNDLCKVKVVLAN